VNELDRFENADIPYVFSFQSLTVKILSKTYQILGEVELDPQFGLIAAYSIDENADYFEITTDQDIKTK